MNRAVFLDLNGTLVLPVKVNDPNEYTFISGTIEALKLLHSSDFVSPVITVQSRIERGIFTHEGFMAWFEKTFSAAGLNLAVYVCPHSSRTGCECHKPKPKLYLDAAADLNLDPSRSYVVGDTYSDIQAGHNIGAKTCFVRTGWADRYLADHGHEADFIGDDILEVARWIVEDNA